MIVRPALQFVSRIAIALFMTGSGWARAAVATEAPSGPAATGSPVSGGEPIETTAIVTSAGLPGVIVLERVNSNVPRNLVTSLAGAAYSLNAGAQWGVLPQTPTLYHNLAIAPRTGPGSPVRFVGGIDNDFVRTGDWGASWAVSPLGRSEKCSHVVQKIWSSPLDATRLFALASCTWYLDDLFPRTTYSLWRSADAGLTWVEVTWPLAYSTFKPVESVFTIGPTLYAIGRHFGGWDDPPGVVVYASSDHGLTWSRAMFIQLDVDTVDDVWVTASLADPQRLYLLMTTLVSGVRGVSGYTSLDHAQTRVAWAQNPCLDPQTLIADPVVTGRLLLACKTGLWRSSDDGASWAQVSGLAGQAIALDLGTPGRVLWARADGLFASTDFGTNWRELVSDYRNGSLFLPTLLRDR